MIARYDIVRECPICNQYIYIKAGRSIPEGIQYIKTKRRSVVLVHTMCVDQKEEKTNEHIKG